MTGWLQDVLGITRLTEKVDRMATQDQVDDLKAIVVEVKDIVVTSTARLDVAVSGVQADLDEALRTGDLTALATSIGELRDATAPLVTVADRLDAVDAEHPVLPPAEPVDPEPVDPNA